MRACLLLLLLMAAAAGEAWRWLPPAAEAPAGRRALLLIADEYADASWNLPTLANNAAALRQGLLAAGWGASAIEELSGARVNSDAIRTALRRAAARLGGEAPLLLVYYTGHGYTAADGAPALCTSATQELPGGGLSATMPVPDLVAWIAEALASSPGAGALLVVDACRNQRTLAPPPPVALQPLAIWQVYSTESGRFAPAPAADRASPFTAAFARALAALAADGQDAGVSRVIEQARLDLQQRREGPLPTLLPAAGGEPLLVRRPRPIPVRVTATDAGSGTVLGAARLTVDGAVVEGPEARIAPGRRQLRLVARGYRPLDATVIIPDEPGGTLLAALSPWLQRDGEAARLDILGLSLRFRRVPAMTARLGSPPGEPGRHRNEAPRTAEIAAFWIAETETTQRLWRAVMGANPSRFVGDDRPVESVSWLEVQAFLQALNERCPGLEARLPSEAEWEAACRAGTATPWSFGADEGLLPRHANYADRRLAESDPDPDRWPGADLAGDDGYGATTAPVARFRPNPWGLYDMHGNVAEWCQDAFAADPTAPPPPSAAAPRSVRGGSWASPPFQTRSAARLGLPPATALPTIGFRLVVASPSGP